MRDFCNEDKFQINMQEVNEYEVFDKCIDNKVEGNTMSNSKIEIAI
jgi:hypothetical protein